MVYEILNRGRENAVPGRRLCSQLGVNMRTLALAVEAERRAGYPICASQSRDSFGFYLAKDSNELISYCRCLQSRENALRETREALLMAENDFQARG